jgi:hypothetical protein
LGRPTRIEQRVPPLSPGGTKQHAFTHRATAKITDDMDELLAFYGYLPSTGSTSARPTRSSRPSLPCYRTKVTTGSGWKAAGLAMAFKLIEAAQGRWRAVNAPHLVALVRNGAVFKKGKLVERSTARGLTETAA